MSTEPTSASLELKVLIDKYSVVRFDPTSTSVASLTALMSCSSKSAVSPCTALSNLSLSPNEISIVLPSNAILDEVGRWSHTDLTPQAVEGGWLALRVEPQKSVSSQEDESKKTLPPGIDFSVVGIMARLSGLLARARVSLFALSTYDTDYILVKEEKIEAAVTALREDGCEVHLEEVENELWTRLGLTGSERRTVGRT